MKRGPVVVVAAADAKLGDLLPRLGEGADVALREGRIFVGVRRASSPSEPIAAGDEVAMYTPRAAGVEAPRILFRSDDVVAVYKPADLATVADHHGRAGALAERVAGLAGVAPESLFATSRLDVGVSGVVLFATTEEARARLSRARKERCYRRHYVAIAARAPTPDAGLWTAPIGRDRDPRKRRAFGKDATEASTAYAVRRTTAQAALLAVEPETGRTHQIRVHASHAGCPLYGDRAYDGPVRTISERGAVIAVRRIALHAAWVEVPDRSAEPMRVEADVPDDLAAIWSTCGGDPSAWDLAWEPLGMDDRAAAT